MTLTESHFLVCLVILPGSFAAIITESYLMVPLESNEPYMSECLPSIYVETPLVSLLSSKALACAYVCSYAYDKCILSKYVGDNKCRLLTAENLAPNKQFPPGPTADFPMHIKRSFYHPAQPELSSMQPVTSSPPVAGHYGPEDIVKGVMCFSENEVDIFCTDGADSHVTVDLGQSYPITLIELATSMHHEDWANTFPGAETVIGDSTDHTQNTLVYTFPGGNSDYQKYKVYSPTISSPVTGRYVTIRNPGTELCIQWIRIY